MTGITDDYDITQPIIRSDGINESERHLKRLCDRTFLSLWSYSGIYRDQSSGGGMHNGKELCDLLVVFENHVIIFSDKESEFPDTGDIVLDWCRWYRRAILNSAEQIYGAERWIRKYPDRLYIDAQCNTKIPVILPDKESIIIHRVAVAHGSAMRCQQIFPGSSGSLILIPAISGEQHCTPDDCMPFAVGNINPEKGYVHVFDDSTLDIILQALDTVADFTKYLTDKEQLLQSGRILSVAGEEELLSCYVSNVNPDYSHYFSLPEDVILTLTEGGWTSYIARKEYKSYLKANEDSYKWDEIIERFNKHILGRTQEYSSHPGIPEQEIAVRYLAREPRLKRRFLMQLLIGMVRKTIDRPYGVRIVLPLMANDPHYVFIHMDHESDQSEPEYREMRRGLLRAYCELVKVKYPDAHMIVGIAIGPLKSYFGSEDVFCIDATTMSPEYLAIVEQRSNELGFLQHYDVSEWRDRAFPAVEPRNNDGIRDRQTSKRKIGRNELCPCGSGMKYKKCCLRKDTGI